MNDIVERMRARILQISDPDDSYTQEDFDKEFSNTTISADPDYFKLKVGFANKSTNPDPEYATAGSSGFDFRANLSEPMTIKAGKRALVPTGLFFELPDGFEIQVRPRSGLAAKNGVTVLNTPGTVDADYRGEIKVILKNTNNFSYLVFKKNAIAQMVFQQVEKANWELVIELDETERGAGGFGHTGKQ